MNSEFSNLLIEVGKNLGIGELSLSQDYAMIGVENILVSVQFLAQAEQVMLYADVGTIPEEKKEDFYGTLLEGQLFFKNTGGGTLSINRAQNIVILQIVQPLALLDVYKFLALLENFVHVVHYWKKKCENFFQISQNKKLTQDTQRQEDSGKFFLRV